MGDLRAKMDLEREMTIDELNALGETEAFTDKDADDYQARLGASGASFVVDGRLSWHFIPGSFKVFLDVDPAEGGRRIYSSALGAGRPDEPEYASPAEAQASAHARVESDRRRYAKHYGLDFTDRSRYDLVIDTTSLTPEQVAGQILDKIPVKH
jgi:cytidylate kinase